MRETTLWTLAIVLIGLALVFPAINVATTDTTEPTYVTNETIYVDYENTTAVNVSAQSYEANATVYNASGAELVGDGTDYEWLHTHRRAAVNWSNTSNTTGGEAASISYVANTNPETTKNVVTMIAPFGEFIAVLALAAGVGTVWRIIGSGW